ncbi:HPr kinase/phosphorylase [Azospirillum sp. CT11-132]|uniref:HPr kinase/phosphorylase n=1 Tax=Azospirillum sp. CT11-132 TaxID=3396317 RepID=UPI0039A734AB
MDYQLCGWRVASDIVIPELLPWMGDDQPAGMHVRLGEPPEALEQSIFATPFLEIAADGTSLVKVMAGRFLVRNGREIMVRPNPAADPQDLSVFLLGTSLGLLLHQRGLFPLHASGVAIGGRGVALSGPSGIGKSTLVAALAARGHELLADDICTIDFGPQGDRLDVLPSLARVKLWQDSLSWFLPDETKAMTAVPGDGPKIQYRFTQAGPALPGAAASPLAAILRLRQVSPVRPPGHVRLLPLQAASILNAQVYRLEQARAMGRDVALFKHCIHIAARVPVYELAYHRDYAGLDEVVRMIERLACPD